MKFAKRIGAVVLAVCMVLSCAGCGGSSNKGASEETTEVITEGGNSKILVAAAASLQATFDNELIPLFEKENPEIAFDKERDKMIVVFDGDIFEEKVLDYDELVAEGEKNNILAVSNPAFELFLLLHYENSYEDDIEPNAEQIIQNEKDGHQTFIYKLLLARTGINPKKNSSIGELAKNIEIAIEQEKKINEDIHQCKGQITCNIGRIIDEIRKDDGK